MKILFVTNAGSSIGLGHLLRCRVLMFEMASQGWYVEVLFVGPADILKRWDWPASVIFNCIDDSLNNNQLFNLLSDMLVENQYNWVIIDGYRFRGESWFNLVNKEHAQLLMIDDIANEPFTANLVLNQNGTDIEFYSERGINSERWLLGTKYALIDSEYVSKRKKNVTNKLGRVLVVFGGADRLNLTTKITQILTNSAPGLHVDVVIGPYSDIDKNLIKNPYIQYHFAPAGLAKLMSAADMVITAAGSTVWQTCAIGCPRIVVQTADNQGVVVSVLSGADAAIIVDAYNIDVQIPNAVNKLSLQSERAYLVERGLKLVDGLGASRVVEALLN